MVFHQSNHKSTYLEFYHRLQEKNRGFSPLHTQGSQSKEKNYGFLPKVCEIFKFGFNLVTPKKRKKCLVGRKWLGGGAARYARAVPRL